MVRYWYFIEAADTAALETAPVFIVKVGETRAAAAAHATLCVRALDNRLYYCIHSEESTVFYGKLMRQNPNREVYELRCEILLKILDGKKELIQNVVHVKNLSSIIRRNMCSLRLGNSLKSYYYVK